MSLPLVIMTNSDFWTGVRLVIHGLADAAKKASFCLGFGAGGLGVALVIVAKLGITGPAGLLISMSAFFILARVGKAVDVYIDRRSLNSRRTPRELREMQHRIERLEYELEKSERRRLSN